MVVQGAMAQTRGGRSFVSLRLEKHQQEMLKKQQEDHVKRKLDEAAFDAPELQRRKKAGKKKGDTHGRDAEPRATFGSADLIDTRGLSASQIRSSQPRDNSQLHGIGDRYAADAPTQGGGIDPRGQGKNGHRMEPGSESDDDDKGLDPEQMSPSPPPLRARSRQGSGGGEERDRELDSRSAPRESAGGWEERDREPDPRSPLREPPSVHRVHNDLMVIKSRSASQLKSGGSGSQVVEQAAMGNHGRVLVTHSFAM